MRPKRDADERVELAADSILALLRASFGADRESALVVINRLIAQHERVAKRDAETHRRIDAMMLISPWIESQSDYARVCRVVDRVAILGEEALLPCEGAVLDRLAALVAAYDAGRPSE